MIIDTHSHILCSQLIERFEEVKQNAMNAGIGKVLIVCTDIAQGRKAVEIAKKDSMFDVAVGFHPCDLYDVTEQDYEALEDLMKEDTVVALGEIGLDYYWKDVDKETQVKGFHRQIKLALKYEKPILIHMREATKDTLDILKEYAPLKGIMHCFSGSIETAREVIKIGLHISFGGPLTFKNSRGAPEVAKEIPVEYLFVETDAPYLTPHPYRGKQNEPMYVKVTFDKLCEIKEMEPKELESIMENNYKKLFHK